VCEELVGEIVNRGILLAVVVLLVAAALSVHADRDVHDVRVVAHADAANCVKETEPCFEIPEHGGLIEEDDRINVTFANNGSQRHALAIAPGEAADPANGTSPEDAFVFLGPIEPGENATAATSIPNGTDSMHLFCTVGDHEEDGMHELRNVFPGGSVQEAENETIGDPGDESQAPLAAAPSLTGLAIAALALGVRRRA
jgi:hypothetical protein